MAISESIRAGTHDRVHGSCSWPIITACEVTLVMRTFSKSYIS